MAIITLTTDFGTKDSYVARIKATILKQAVSVDLIDISHQVEKYDIKQAAFLLNSVLKSFPLGTVHLVFVNDAEEFPTPIAIAYEGQFFVGYDNGLFSWVLPHEKAKVITIPSPPNDWVSEEALAYLAYQLSQGVALEKLGSIRNEFKCIMPLNPQMSRERIIGHIDYVDSFGNLISNVSKSQVAEIMAINNENQEVTFRYGVLELRYQEIQHLIFSSGKGAMYYNDMEMLCVIVMNGSAAELLGKEEQLIITFV